MTGRASIPATWSGSSTATSPIARTAEAKPDGDGIANGSGHFGIGLWVVRRNAEALGGGVTAVNRDPHGLTVRVRLPLA